MPTPKITFFVLLKIFEYFEIEHSTAPERFTIFSHNALFEMLKEIFPFGTINPSDFEAALIAKGYGDLPIWIRDEVIGRLELEKHKDKKESEIKQIVELMISE